MTNWIDILLAMIVLLSTMTSVLRGFTRETLSLIVWLTAAWLATHFAARLAPWLNDYIATPKLRPVVAFVGLFVVSVLAGGLLNNLWARCLQKTGLTGTDRALGTLFGFARGLVFCSVLLFVLSMTTVTNSQAWRESWLLPYFRVFLTWLVALLPDNIAMYFQSS